MLHEMKLDHEPFLMIKFRTKTVEMRLYDEKRKAISIGDTIAFTDRNNGEIALTRVKSLQTFADFTELYSCFDKTKLGYLPDEIADPRDMELYYSSSDIEKYGVIAIEIEII